MNTEITEHVDSENQSAEVENIKCPKCGQELPAFAVACPYCGKKIAPNTSLSKRTKIIIGCACLCVVFVIAGIAGVKQYKQHQIENAYTQAIAEFNSGDEVAAVKTFSQCIDYKDSKTRVENICENYFPDKYEELRANSKLESQDDYIAAIDSLYDDCMALYNSVPEIDTTEYSDLLQSQLYQVACNCVDGGIRKMGVAIFKKLGNYLRSEEYANYYSDPPTLELTTAKAVDSLYSALKNPESLTINSIRFSYDEKHTVISYSATNSFGATVSGYAVCDASGLNRAYTDSLAASAYQRASTEVDVNKSLILSTKMEGTW